TGLILVASQVGERVDGALQSPGGALRRAAAEEIGEDLDRDVGERGDGADARPDEHPDPEPIAAGLDAMDDCRPLKDVGQQEIENSHAAIVTHLAAAAVAGPRCPLDAICSAPWGGHDPSRAAAQCRLRAYASRGFCCGSRTRCWRPHVRPMWL